MESFTVEGQVCEVYKIYFDRKFINSESYNRKYDRNSNNSLIQVTDIHEKFIILVEKIFIADQRCFLSGKKISIKEYMKIPRLNVPNKNYFAFETSEHEMCLELSHQRVEILFKLNQNATIPPNSFEQY